MRCKGIALIWIKPEGGENTLIEALVSSTLTDDLLLSCGDMKRLNMLHPEFPKPIMMTTSKQTTEQGDRFEDTDMEKLRMKYKKVFNDKLETNKVMSGGPMHIKVNKDDGRPYHCNQAREVPLSMQDEASKMVKELLKSKGSH